MSVYLIVDVEKERLRTRFNRLMIPDNTCDVFLIALRNVIEIIGESSSLPFFFFYNINNEIN